MYSVVRTFKSCFQLMFFCILTLRYINSQKILSGYCPSVTPMVEFDRDRYMGRWYQQAMFKSFLREEAMCRHSVYKPIEDGGFRLETRMVTRVLNGPVSIYGVVKPAKRVNSLPGQFVMTLFGETSNEVSSYYILYTDYSEISVVWSCDSFYKLWSKQNIQVFTRARTVNTTMLLASTLKALLPQQLDHLLDLLSPIDQSECEEIIPT